MAGSYYTSRGAVGSGSGGGRFFGTQTLDNGGSSLLGFHSVPPLIAVLSGLAEEVQIQYVSNVLGPYMASDFNVRVRSSNKLFYVFNMLPTSPSATASGNGWSTLTVFRTDGLFEVFALTWTESSSYSFVAAQTPFELGEGGLARAASAPTTMDLYIQGTYPTPAPRELCYNEAVSSLRAGFVCSAKLFQTSAPQRRSALLQSYVLAGSS